MPGLYVFSNAKEVDIGLIMSVINAKDIPTSISFEKAFDLFKKVIIRGETNE